MESVLSYLLGVWGGGASESASPGQQDVEKEMGALIAAFRAQCADTSRSRDNVDVVRHIAEAAERVASNPHTLAQEREAFLEQTLDQLEKAYPSDSPPKPPDSDSDSDLDLDSPGDTRGGSCALAALALSVAIRATLAQMRDASVSPSPPSPSFGGSPFESPFGGSPERPRDYLYEALAAASITGGRPEEALSVVTAPNPYACAVLGIGSSGGVAGTTVLRVLRRIGEGAFGAVHGATMRGVSGIPLVVKVTRERTGGNCSVMPAAEFGKKVRRYTTGEMPLRFRDRLMEFPPPQKSDLLTCPRFWTEAAATAAASDLVWKGISPHFLRHFGSFVCRGTGYTIVERSGNTLREEIAAGRIARPDHVLSVILQTLAAIHSLQTWYGGMHHDLHPGNILITPVGKGSPPFLWGGGDVRDLPHLIHRIDGGTVRIPHFGTLVRLADMGMASITLRPPSGSARGVRMGDADLVEHSGVSSCRNAGSGAVTCHDWGEVSARFRAWYDPQVFLVGLDDDLRRAVASGGHALHTVRALEASRRVVSHALQLAGGRADTSAVRSWKSLDSATRRRVRQALGGGSGVTVRLGDTKRPLWWEGAGDDDLEFAWRTPGLLLLLSPHTPRAFTTGVLPEDVTTLRPGGERPSLLPAVLTSVHPSGGVSALFRVVEAFPQRERVETV